MDDRREMLYAGLLFIALALLFGALARGQAATLPDRPFNDTTPADCNKRTGNATTTLGCFDVLPGDIKRMVSGSAPGGDIIVADPDFVHLCPPDICNGAMVLNPPLAPHRGVIDFLVLSTGRVVYRADKSVDSKYELWSVPITGGASVKVNAALASNDDDVDGYTATSDGLTVVYRAGRTDSGNWKLYRARATGGHVAQISETVTGSRPVDSYFRIAPDDLSVVYLLTNPARELYSTPLAQPHSTKINQPLVTGGRVYDGFSIDGCGHVRYRADAVVRGRIQWWLGKVGGGVVMEEIFSDSFESGGMTRWTQEPG